MYVAFVGAALVILTASIFFKEIEGWVREYIMEHGFLMFASQAFITVLGVPAIYFSQSLRHDTKKWGSVCGLAGQPFWYIMAVSASAWGVLFMSVFYTHAWWTGFRNHWLHHPDNKKHPIELAAAKLIQNREERLSQCLQNLYHLEGDQLRDLRRAIDDVFDQRSEIG